jgi:hypothetical protein
MMHGPLGGTQYGTCAANWTYGTRVPGHRSSKGADCGILAQDKVGLIEYSYHQGIPSFLKAQL